MKYKANSERGDIGPIGGRCAILAVFLFLAVFLSVVSLGGMWIAQGNDFFLYKVFAPRMEQVRHDVVKNSQAYTTGMLQELRHAQLSYQTADADHKAMIGSIVLHQFADFDEAKLPLDLQIFYAQLKREQGVQ